MLNNWLVEENSSIILGVLATTDQKGMPYTRTIAIREIDENHALFFTQKGSKKVTHMNANPSVSLTILLQENRRQITFRGQAEPLSPEKNNHYWNSYPKQSQVRFMVYGPKSGSLENANGLDQELARLKTKYKGASVAMPDAYLGFLVKPEAIELYQYNTDRISDSFHGKKENGKWVYQRVVP